MAAMSPSQPMKQVRLPCSSSTATGERLLVEVEIDQDVAALRHPPHAGDADAGARRGRPRTGP